MATEYAPRANVLSAANLSTLIRRSIPTQSDPQIKSPYDAIALASHASMLAVGFRMVGLGEDHKLENTSDRDETHELPAEWNANAGTYAFRYKHEQSSMEFLLKANRMGNKVMIMGMGLGDDRTCSFDLKVQEFISEGNLPATPKKDGASDEEIEKAIVDIFINIGRLSDLGSLHRLSIIQKLAPSLQKPGYEESSEGQSSNTRQSESRDRTPRQDPLRDDRNPPARPFPLADPLAQPRRPMPEPMPGFEDEFETGRPARGGLPGGGFPNIGDRDLYPQGLGPRDPLRGGVGPGFGGMGGGGMHPTFDDPMFAGQGQRGNGFDPQVPPGARFDPMGPGPRGGAGHPRGAGMGGRPPNPFGGFGDGDFL